MSKNKELADYIMDQLSDLGNIRNIPMMGGYIFYYKERIFGGIDVNGRCDRALSERRNISMRTVPIGTFVLLRIQ